MHCSRFAIVPAAGSGSRFGSVRPKQYAPIHGRPMLEHTVRALASCRDIDCVYVVLAEGDSDFGECRWADLEAPIMPLYCGGPTRSCSVFNALMALRSHAQDDDWILVHDAARPCLSATELDRLFAALNDDDIGGLLALPVTDTLKRADEHDRVASTASREGLWRALTPQMFRYRLLVEALHRARTDAVTDEAAAVEKLGLQPRLVAGAATNIKVTYAEDLVFAQIVLAERNPT
jgi:2-C-methyl-D-erythritol 4-phosphate cytidylyltransferase